MGPTATHTAAGMKKMWTAYRTHCRCCRWPLWYVQTLGWTSPKLQLRISQ